jgi:AcrR family transcriptional regulator
MSSDSLAAVSDRRTTLLDAAIAVIARDGVRGLRVENVAAEAGVAVSLIYYYFGSRKGLVRATLDHANERAARAAHSGPRELLLGELDLEARDGSVVWGEILSSAVFEPALREQVRDATGAWVTLVAGAIEAAQRDGSIAGGVNAADAAERLTALVDVLSARWLAGALERERARELLATAIARELG